MKGQYFSFDAIIAAVIFVLALVALLSYWHSVRSFLEYQNDPLTKETIRISNNLFAPPSPSETCTTMDKFGLALSIDDRRVNARILGCVEAQSEAWLQKVLGTSYNATIKVTNIESGAETLIGSAAPSTASNVVNIRRLATVYNPNSGATYLATVDLTLYTMK